MKYILGTFIVLYSMAMVVACGSNNTNNTTDPNALYPCPAGSTFYNGNCVSGYGGYGGYGNVVQSGLGFNSSNYSQNTLSITNSTVYNRFLKEVMALCDQGYYNAGTSSCSTYSGAYIMATLQAVDANANAARLTVQVYPRYSNFGGWFTVGPMNYATARNPIAFDMTVSLINNSQGIEARSYGGANTIGALHLLQFIVTNGKLSDNYFDYKLAYDGTGGGVFMTGRMNKCSDATCTLVAH